MAQWATFAGITGVVLVLLLVLSYLTQTAFSDDTDSVDSRGTDRPSSPSAPAPDDRRDAPTSESSASAASDSDATPDSEESGSGRDRRASSESIAPSDGDGPFDSDSDGAVESNPAGPPETGADADAGPDPDPDVDRTAPAERARDDEPVRSPSDPSATPGVDAERGDRPRNGVDPQSLSTGELLANVALSQGLFACVLLGAVVYTGIPADALGIEFSTGYLREGLVWGAAVGLVLYAANEIGAAAATRFGFDHDEQLRSLLAPDALRGWLVLLTFVLPLIAGFEELLFRAALIGALSSGFAVDPWLLAVVSSIAFAVGHGMQGSVGIVVTGLLGFVLAAVFIVTGSFLVVVVAHYLINALEFAVHEGLEFDWAEALEG